MTEEIESFLKLYEHSPSLVLYENLAKPFGNKENKTNLDISQLVNEEKLNPIDVVLESLVNVISEEISRKEFTHSEDKVLINSRIRNLAAEKILKAINNDKERLRHLHQSWLQMLREFLRQLCQNERKLRIDRVIFEVSSRFRISSPSAIKAIATVIQKEP
jgi:NAD dependent epimerase/dehydratase family enzyme